MRLTRTTARGGSALLVSALVLLGAATTVTAQVLQGSALQGSVELGGLFFLTDGPKNKERAKLAEYRDLTTGPFLDLQLKFFDFDTLYSSEIRGSRLGRQDQEFSLRTGRLGLWELEFDWDQTPHVFSTTARTSAHEIERGKWALPNLASLSDFNGQATSRELHDVAVRWDTGHLGFKLTPRPDLELSAEYTRIRKEGNRPFSMAFGFNTNNFLELLAPIEETIHDFRIGGTLARETWQLQFEYALSVFENDLKRVIFDNPCGQLALACPDSIAAFAPGRGQSSLAPSNMAHTLTIGGGLDLPLRTRVTGSFSWSLALQNDAFLPHTINPAIAGDPDLRLPQQGLNGQVQTFNVYLQATSRPLPLPLTLTAKYRLYDLHDLSDRIIFPGSTFNDFQLVSRTATVAERGSFTRHNADVDARYQVARPLAVTLGAGWERWNRGPDREVQESDELFAKAAVDATPFEWLLARLTYRPSFRRDADYNRQVSPNQLFDARRFDEAERDRHRVELMLQLSPIDTLSITPTGAWRYDDYLRSAFGLQWETSWSAGIDISWRPTARLSLAAGYMHEVVDRNLRSTSNNNNVNFAWLSNMTDTFDTFHLSGKVALIPKVLDWTVSGSYATSVGTIETRNPDATLTGPPLTAASQAKRMPDFDDQLVRIQTALRYRFAKSWAASLSYEFSSFRNHDWRTDGWLPFNPTLAGTTGSIWLGNDVRNYDAHFAGVTLSYIFE